MAAVDATDPVAYLGTVESACSLNRSFAGRKDDSLAARKPDGLGPSLHSRPLLDQEKLATREVFVRSIEQAGDLERKRHVPVDVLVKTVEATCPVTQQQRGWPQLVVSLAVF